MISRKCRGITFLGCGGFRHLPPPAYSALLKRDQSAFFLVSKKQTFLNWSKTLYLGGGG